MTLLSAAQITSMRATADLALPDTVVISRRSVARCLSSVLGSGFSSMIRLMLAPM